MKFKPQIESNAFSFSATSLDIYPIFTPRATHNQYHFVMLRKYLNLILVPLIQVPDFFNKKYSRYKMPIFFFVNFVKEIVYSNQRKLKKKNQRMTKK